MKINAKDYCNILFATVIVAGDVFVVVAAYPDNCASFIANKKELPFFLRFIQSKYMYI